MIGGSMNEERDEEREPGQHATIHEQAEPTADLHSEDTNEYADERVDILQPDGEPAPVAKDEEEARAEDRNDN